MCLIDLVTYPANKLAPGLRRRALRDHARDRVEDVLKLAPKGIIVCNGPNFEALSPLLRTAAAPPLHDEPIPFPLGNHRAKFVELFRAARARLA